MSWRVCSCMVLFACSQQSMPVMDAGSTYMPPPSSVVVDDPGAFKIRREVFLVDGFAAPGTPAEQNRVRVVRYRIDATPPRPARAIAVMMPGFLGGAGSFDGLARAIVRRSTNDDAFEAWAIDRRSNLLEDTHGLDVAESRKDVSWAKRYYQENETVEGRTYAPLVPPNFPWASEWGLETTVEDLRRVIARVPSSERKARVFLVGHSLGGAIAEEFASWDFAGEAGYASLAGLVLVDGVAGNEGKMPTTDRATYENGKPQSMFGPQPGVLTELRAKHEVFTSLPFVGVKALIISEYVAMQARFAPNEVSVDPVRDTTFGVLLGLGMVPKMTNRAAFGFAFDDRSCPLQIAAVACGSGTGGPIAEYDGVLGGKLVHPTDPNATYGWLEFDAVNEITSIDDAARAWYEGPQLNFSEWYFPQRLTIDASAASTLDTMPGDWRLDTYNLRAMHGKTIDAPVLAVGSVVAKTGAYETLRAFLPPVGANRPNATKPRSDPDAFAVIDEPSFTHIDWLVGADRPGSRVANFYDAVVRFMRSNSTAGSTSIPIQ